MSTKPDGPSTEPTAAPGSIASQFTKIGGLRDSLLVASFFIYLFGYVSWLLFASENGYGFLSVLEAQYLTAGIAPAIICLVAYVCWLRLYRYGVSLPSHRRSKAASAVGVIGMLGVGLLALSEFTHLAKPGFTSWAGVVLLVLGCLPLVAVYLEGAASSSPLLHRVSVHAISAAPVAAALMLWWFYTFFVFGDIPHEFGGPYHCAFLEFDTSKTSRETLKSLMNFTRGLKEEQVLPNPLPPILGVNHLTLVFEGSDYFIVAGSIPEAKVPLYRSWVRLQARAVLAVRECRPGT